MTLSPPQDPEWAQRWDQLYQALSAEPRRMIIASLLDTPRERRLPLPDAAESPNQEIDAETLDLRLRHHHLPMLEETEYVRWEEDPFVVQRGPRFEEPALIIEKVTESIEELPPPLIDNCRVFREEVNNGTQ